MNTSLDGEGAQQVQQPYEPPEIAWEEDLPEVSRAVSCLWYAGQGEPCASSEYQ